MYHVYDIMGPEGRRLARYGRDSSIPLTVDGTARRVPGKGPGTGSGRVERRAAVLPGFELLRIYPYGVPGAEGAAGDSRRIDYRTFSYPLYSCGHRCPQGSEGVKTFYTSILSVV